MTTAQVSVQNPMDYVKKGVREQAEKRQFFLKTVYPTLIEGQDYFVIDGRKVISKGGCERLAEIYGFSCAEFSRDSEVLASFGNPNGLIAFICRIRRGLEQIAEGRGSADVKDCEASVNVAIKAAQASSYKDAILRATGTSFMFTQDIDQMEKFKGKIRRPPEKSPYFSQGLEMMPEPVVHTATATEEVPDPRDERGNADDHYNNYERVASEEEGGAEEGPKDQHAMTEKQRNFLTSLIAERISDKEQTEEWLARLDSGLSISDASELISSLIPAR